MKKSFWISVCVLIITSIIIYFKWDVIQQNQADDDTFFIVSFVLFALLFQYFYVFIILVPVMILLIVFIIRKTDFELIKTFFVMVFMFIVAMQLIYTVSIIGLGTKKEEVIKSYGGVDAMYEQIEENLANENSKSELKLVSRTLTEVDVEDSGIQYPKVDYVYEIQGKDDLGVSYSGDVSFSVVCTDENVYLCDLEQIKFTNLQNADGSQYIVKSYTQEELVEVYNSWVYSYWKLNPRLID